MKFRTLLSMTGSVLLGQGIPYAWWILLIANMMWILYHLEKKNYESLQLHVFYAVNALVAICM